MKTNSISLFILCFFALGCNEKEKTEVNNEIVVDSTTFLVNDEHNARNSLDYIGTYEGIIPCADCEGIKTSLSLEDDKNYVLKTTYLGKKNATTNEVRGTYSWNKKGNTIVLSDNENGASHYFVGENHLTQLDLEGNEINGDLAEKYVLQKKSDSGELVPPSPLEKVSDEGLQFIKWKLVELNGVKINNNSNKPMFIHLIKDNQFTAFAGCNNMMGSYELIEKWRIKFTKGASTMMACPDMTTEHEFAEMLEKVDNYSLNGNKLSFNRARMAPLARFEAIK